MQDFAHILNSILVEVYHNILRVEEDFLRKNNRIDLSIREMHLIECVGMDRETGKTVSEIAEYLKVARPSVTVMVNKLERKGYLEKQGSRTDGRMVCVRLSREGRKVEAYHRQYHMNMVREIEKEFDPAEQELLIRTIVKLNDFFKKGVGDAQ
ncbi:MAG TPA: MarR family transcriptional regulator [Oscillospiraceae bacterium]|nr:MarR family transcriptional regulator [Oscillospiraceae bacterium]